MVDSRRWENVLSCPWPSYSSSSDDRGGEGGLAEAYLVGGAGGAGVKAEAEVESEMMMCPDEDETNLDEHVMEIEPGRRWPRARVVWWCSFDGGDSARGYGGRGSNWENGVRVWDRVWARGQ